MMAYGVSLWWPCRMPDPIRGIDRPATGMGSWVPQNLR